MRTIGVLFLMLVVATGPARAQDCTIAAYADPAGRESYAYQVEPQRYRVYVVMHVENTVAAAAYSMMIPGLNTEVFLWSRSTGPSGGGLSLDEPTGTNSALAECAIGFGGNPVVVDTYEFMALTSYDWQWWSLGPNSSQDPDFPQYVTCNDVTLDCEVGPDLCVACTVPNGETSFSKVKSLYH